MSHFLSETDRSRAAVIAGATFGAVVLLLSIVVVTLCIRRKRRLGRYAMTNTPIAVGIVPYLFTAPVTRAGNGEGKRGGTEARNTINAGAARSHRSSHTATISNTICAPQARAVPQDLDISAAAAMFRQLERFLRSLNVGSNMQQELPSVSDGDSDSLPQY